MRLFGKILLISSVLVYTGTIKSFDDIQNMYLLSEENDSALLELNNANNLSTSSNEEISPFGLALEPWDEPLSEDTHEQNIPDSSALIPSTSSGITSETSYNDIFLPQYMEAKMFPAMAHVALRKSGHLGLKIPKKNDTKKFKCKYRGCAYATPYKYNFKRHKYTHTGEKPHKCDHPECTFATGDISNLVLHKSIHTKLKPYACDHQTCTFTTSRKTYLTKHKNNIHLRVQGQEDCVGAKPKNKKQRRE